jgi:hypothetical protein
MLAAADSTHAISADQDHPAHLCNLIMVCTVVNSVSTIFEFSQNEINSCVQDERSPSQF